MVCLSNNIVSIFFYYLKINIQKIVMNEKDLMNSKNTKFQFADLSVCRLLWCCTNLSVLKTFTIKILKQYNIIQYNSTFVCQAAP